MNAFYKAAFQMILSTAVVYLAIGIGQASAMNCQDYANQAVQDYRAMESHPACHVDKSLRWQNNYMNHYNGCLLMSDALLQSEEAARLAHLHDCGAL